MQTSKVRLPAEEHLHTNSVSSSDVITTSVEGINYNKKYYSIYSTMWYYSECIKTVACLATYRLEPIML